MLHANLDSQSFEKSFADREMGQVLLFNMFIIQFHFESFVA
jgi:hypothetical protein